jgi:hypothetical protein
MQSVIPAVLPGVAPSQDDELGRLVSLTLGQHSLRKAI